MSSVATLLAILNLFSAAQSACVHKDPHFVFAHGGKADLKGEDNAIYNLLSAKNFSLAGRFKHTTFTLPGPMAKLVHGSFMYDGYVSVLSSLTGRRINIEFSSAKGRMATISQNDQANITLFPRSKPYVAENVQVTMAKRELTVSNGQWSVVMTSAVYDGINATTCTTGRCTLNININPVYDVDSDPVAPHGIVGQSFDRDEMAVDGKQDDYRSPIEVHTSAMAEGAIEGEAAEYKLTSPFATSYKYSRFNSSIAVPRDVSKLSGVKRRRTIGASPSASAFGDGVELEMLRVEYADDKEIGGGRRLTASGCPDLGTCADLAEYTTKQTLDSLFDATKSYYATYADSSKSDGNDLDLQPALQVICPAYESVLLPFFDALCLAIISAGTSMTAFMDQGTQFDRRINRRLQFSGSVGLDICTSFSATKRSDALTPGGWFHNGVKTFCAGWDKDPTHHQSITLKQAAIAVGIVEQADNSYISPESYEVIFQLFILQLLYSATGFKLCVLSLEQFLQLLQSSTPETVFANLDETLFGDFLGSPTGADEGIRIPRITKASR